MADKSIIVKNGDKAFFHNQVDFCVGTGRMGLALQKEYQDQLKMVQEMIGFKHIRGHGLFTDDMAIYHTYKDADGKECEEYNFTYLDLVMDSYLEKNITPFLELGFMPEKMATGTQTIFYWKGNVTPPTEYAKWNRMVQATLRHLMERYGEEEVVTWPIEVWNEPNLPGFWQHADMQEYFKLFKETFYAIKEVNPKFRVGGPAICGVDDVRWMQCFMEFVNDNKIPVDFITRHHYTSEPPKPDGHYGYPELSDADEGFEVLQKSREIIDSFPDYKGLEMHITEFNTSYIPNAPVHDTNQNAAYIAYLLSKMGDMNESYSYWTFGDIFEEVGVPYAPFHGGFGMVANGCIPKPTFWTFLFFKKLQGECVCRDRNAVIMKNGSKYCGVVWNDSRTRTGETLNVEISLPADGKTYYVNTKTVDEDTCNPLKAWHDMGEPRHLSAAQKELLRDMAKPFVQTKQVSVENGAIDLSMQVKEHGVIYFEAEAVEMTSDRGYDYARVMQMQ